MAETSMKTLFLFNVPPFLHHNRSQVRHIGWLKQSVETQPFQPKTLAHLNGTIYQHCPSSCWESSCQAGILPARPQESPASGKISHLTVEEVGKKRFVNKRRHLCMLRMEAFFPDNVRGRS